jgi:hypothetical protein
MIVLDIVITTVILGFAAWALFDFWRFIQVSIVCAVCVSDYEWHWAPPHSILAPVTGILLAAIFTGLCADIRDGRPVAFAKRRWQNLLSLAALVGLRRQPGRLLGGDNRSE